MFDKEELKRQLVETLRNEDKAAAARFLTELTDEVIQAISGADLEKDYIFALGAFWAMGASTDPRSFLKLKEGDQVYDEVSDETFTVLSVPNSYTYILKHKNLSMKFVVNYSFDLDEMSLGFVGDVYVYDKENKVKEVIPHQVVVNLFSA